MWDYLKKHKNNHTTSSLPQMTRPNASLDTQIWITGPPTLNPLNWHCFRFALGHHLFQHPFSPYDDKSAQDVAKLLPSLKIQASTATTTTHPLFMTPFTLDELKPEIKKLHPGKSQGPSGITPHAPCPPSWIPSLPAILTPVLLMCHLFKTTYATLGACLSTDPIWWGNFLRRGKPLKGGRTLGA